MWMNEPDELTTESKIRLRSKPRAEGVTDKQGSGGTMGTVDFKFGTLIRTGPHQFDDPASLHDQFE